MVQRRGARILFRTDLDSIFWDSESVGSDIDNDMLRKKKILDK